MENKQSYDGKIETKNGWPFFDPNPSINFALELLSKAGLSQYALIGKLAMWIHIDDESQHEFTKDVDFAVLLKDASHIEEEASRQGVNYKHLYIGGIAIRDFDGETQINVDFIDRRLDRIDPLYAKAIEEAVEIRGKSLSVVSLEYLIAMKAVSGEEKDDKDLKLLLSLNKANYQKVRDIVENYLGPVTARRLDVFAREAGILPRRGPYID